MADAQGPNMSREWNLEIGEKLLGIIREERNKTMLRKENQPRGHFPLDEYRNERARPLMTFVVTLWVGTSAEKVRALVVEVESDTQTNAVSQARQDYASEASRVVHEPEVQIMKGTAIWLAVPKE